MITVLRPLSLSELLDRTFHFYRNYFLLFLGINGMPQLIVLAMLLSGALLLRTHRETSVILTLLGYLLFYVAFFFSQAPTIVAVSNVQTQKPASIGSSYAAARRASLRVLWIIFLIGVIFTAIFLLAGAAFGVIQAGMAATLGDTAAVVVGVICLAIGLGIAILLLVDWSLVIPITVLEGGWFLKSIRRSKVLMRGSRWRAFVVYLLMGVLGTVVTLIFEFLLIFSVSLLRIRDYRTIQMVLQVVMAVALFMSISVVGALLTIALSLFYFDQRVRKEGYDLQLMLSDLQPASTAASAAAPVS